MTDEPLEQEIARIIDEVEGRDEHLTAWERSFVDGVQSRAAAGIPLTDGQLERLREVHRRVCP